MRAGDLGLEVDDTGDGFGGHDRAFTRHERGARCVPGYRVLMRDGGCTFCRDGGITELDHFERVSSTEAQGFLVTCPYCACLYVDPTDGVTQPYPIERPDAARWVNWSSEAVLSAVRTTLSGRRSDGWTFERAEIDGDAVLVVFQTEDQSRYGVRYELSDVPTGNNTGTLCATPEEWASEIGWTMDEQVLTGGLRRAQRTGGSNGLTMLRWVW